MKRLYIFLILSVLSVSSAYGQALAPDMPPQVALVEEEEELFFEEERDLEELDLEEFEEA